MKDVQPLLSSVADANLPGGTRERTSLWLAGKVDQKLNTVAVVSGGNLTPATMQQLFALAGGQA